jgi:hypothetical protein
MIEAIKAQLLKHVVGAMVTVGLSLMPSKVIGRKVFLWARAPFGLSKDHGPKVHPNISRRKESKEMKDSTKVEEEGVHRKKYDGRCMK